jgi:hypothetical protein
LSQRFVVLSVIFPLVIRLIPRPNPSAGFYDNKAERLLVAIAFSQETERLAWTNWRTHTVSYTIIRPTV